MVESDKVQVSIYQIDKAMFFKNETFDEIVEKIITTANVKRAETPEREEYEEDNLANPQHYAAYSLRLFSTWDIGHPRWLKFLRQELPLNARLKNAKNKHYSFVLFVGYENEIFAITGGSGNFAVEFYISQEFGIEVLTRLIRKDDKVVKEIHDRGVAGALLGSSRFYRGDQKLTE